MSICAGTQRWTVSYRDRRGSCEQLGTSGGRQGSVASSEAPVERVDQVQLSSGSSGRESEQEKPSGEGAEGGSGSVEPFPAQGPRGSGMRNRDPREARGHTALCRRNGGGGTKSCGCLGQLNRGYFISKTKHEQQTQSRSDIPGGRKINYTNKYKQSFDGMRMWGLDASRIVYCFQGPNTQPGTGNMRWVLSS